MSKGLRVFSLIVAIVMVLVTIASIIFAVI